MPTAYYYDVPRSCPPACRVHVSNTLPPHHCHAIPHARNVYRSRHQEAQPAHILSSGELPNGERRSWCEDLGGKQGLQVEKKKASRISIFRGPRHRKESQRSPCGQGSWRGRRERGGSRGRGKRLKAGSMQVPADVLVERLRGRENNTRLVSSSYLCNQKFQASRGKKCARSLNCRWSRLRVRLHPRHVAESLPASILTIFFFTGVFVSFG